LFWTIYKNTGLSYSLYCVVQNSSLSHASTLQTRPKNSHSVYIDGRDTNLFVWVVVFDLRYSSAVVYIYRLYESSDEREFGSLENRFA
jgi:hypothetical protein